MVPANTLWTPTTTRRRGKPRGSGIPRTEVVVRWEGYEASLGLLKNGEGSSLRRVPENDIESTLTFEDGMRAGDKKLERLMIEDAIDECWAQLKRQALRMWE